MGLRPLLADYSSDDLHLIVYDLTAMRTTNRIVAHDDDVNSCCWADSTSGNVLISASDDTFLKVWYASVNSIIGVHPHRNLQGSTIL